MNQKKVKIKFKQKKYKINKNFAPRESFILNYAYKYLEKLKNLKIPVKINLFKQMRRFLSS